MGTYHMTWMKRKRIRRAPMRLAALPLFLFVALAFLLAACSNADATSASTPASATQGTVATTSSNTVATSKTSLNMSGTTKPTLPLKSIRMLDTQNGWALTASSILRTADGGVHWKDVTPANASLNQFARGDFLNGQYAWIAIPPANMQEGAGIAILRTSNGGISWQRSKVNDPLVSIIDVPHFLNAQQGWLEASSTPGAGHAGSDIWHSIDGGQTWTKLSSNADSSGLRLAYVNGISFKDAQNGIAAGNLGAGGDNSVPSIAITHTGGKTWQVMLLPHLLGGYTMTNNNSQPPVFFGNVVFLPVNVSTPSDNLLVLYRSNDSGQHWFQTSVVHITAQNTYVLDPSHAWATDTTSGKFYRTTDGGNHWNLASNTAYHLQALSFPSASMGWGISNQSLLHTTDGGKTWQQIHYTIH